MRAFYDLISVDPLNIENRLSIADRLSESGSDDRAALIRIQCAIDRLYLEDPILYDRTFEIAMLRH